MGGRIYFFTALLLSDAIGCIMPCWLHAARGARFELFARQTRIVMQFRRSAGQLSPARSAKKKFIKMSLLKGVPHRRGMAVFGHFLFLHPSPTTFVVQTQIIICYHI